MDKFKQMAKDLGANNLVLHTKRIVDSSIETGYQSACDYPLVLGAGILLLLMHRICPPLLAFLVSSSPLLLLTGLLLGALLSYGEPSTPSVIGEEASDNQETLSQKSKNFIADCSVQDAENVTIETHPEKGAGSAGFYVAERTPVNNTHDTHWEETNVTFLAANTVLSTESTQTSVIAGREMYVEEISEKVELQEFESSNTERGNYEVHNHYQLGDSMSPCWQSAERRDPCYDSESDLTDESSSPDASITDIIPMLEELHPLIDLETGHPALGPMHGLNSSSDDDEDDIEEEDDDTSDDGDEDEGEEEEKDDGNNQEDVRGNNSGVDGLMELRRAKNILKFELDQRLMDLQTADATEKLEEASRFYVQVPSISTPREKPFDPSNVSDEVIELPRIPDSAPSVLLPSQNLFDDHDIQLQETWTPRLYSPATQLKHGNLHGRQSTNPHRNGLKVEKGDIDGEDALHSFSVSDAGKDDKLSQEAHVGEEIKILSAASSGADVFKVDSGRHEDYKNSDFSDDINSFPIMKNGSSTSEAKDSVQAGSEESTLCCLSKANDSEKYAVEANSIDEVNSLFRCRMEEVLEQSNSEPIIGQPLTVKLEDEPSDPTLSSDSGPIQEKSGEVFPAVGEHSPELTIGDGSRELLTVEKQQIADSSDLHVMEASSVEEMKTLFKQLEHVPHNSSGYTLSQDTLDSASDMLSLETETVEDGASALEQVNTSHNEMEMSQNGEIDLKPYELSSPLQVKEAQTLDDDSDCELKDSAEKPKSVAFEGRHGEDV